jgi:endonuclease I
MQTDLFIVYPTDYFVNSRRGDLPYGVVTSAIQTFTNGCKIGYNTYAGSPATNCFEPIDSFKGDIARNYFYVSTCYRDDSATFTSWEMANHVNLNPWVVQMLLDWHHNDPVSKKEIDRNNAVYAQQGNRNPFIDHPEYVDCIWGSGVCNANNKVQDQNGSFAMNIYPNPTNE